LGGLVAIACLQRLLEVQTKASATVLSTHITAGNDALMGLSAARAGQLTGEGVTGLYAQQLTFAKLAASLWQQAKLIAFNQGFTALIAMFLCALPLVLLLKLGLGRSPKLR